MPNTRIARKQNGAAWQLGGGTPWLSDHDYTSMRYALAQASLSEYTAYFDDFHGDTLRAEWATDLSASVTIAPPGTTEQNGTIVFTTTTTSGDKATLALGLHWLVSSGDLYFEARVANTTAITARAVEIGVAGALTQTNGLSFSNHTATPTAVATNAAVFGYNTANSMTSWSALAVNGGGTPVGTILTPAPVADTYQRFGIWIDSTGKATYYIDGVQVAQYSAAIATTAKVTPWVTLTSNSAASKIMRADYVFIMGRR